MFHKKKACLPEQLDDDDPPFTQEKGSTTFQSAAQYGRKRNRFIDLLGRWMIQEAGSFLTRMSFDRLRIYY